MRKSGWLVAAASVSLAPASGAVSDNRQYSRGPTHHGIGHETNLPVEWGPSETRPRIHLRPEDFLYAVGESVETEA